MPSDDVIRTLREILESSTSGIMDLVWGPDLDFLKNEADSET